jgi:glycerate 2-kinase
MWSRSCRPGPIRTRRTKRGDTGSATLSQSLEHARQDLVTIARAGVSAAGAAAALSRALADELNFKHVTSVPVHLIAAGKAAAPMTAAWFALPQIKTVQALAVGTHRDVELPTIVEWREARHPVPDERSVEAATRALAIARAVPADGLLVLLLSGGASALLARPMPGISLADKQQVVEAMLRGGADIHALNTVRKHLSEVKGGRLAASCAGTTMTLAISDVVGDDLAVIGSGPGVPDSSTWVDAVAALNRHVAEHDQPVSVRATMAEGVAGQLPDTPKADSAAMSRVQAHVIGSRFDAMRGAGHEAGRLGYRPVILVEPVTGEARASAALWAAQVREQLSLGATCVISSGETTVHVTGRGRGGRNLEFALALARTLATLGGDTVAASVGTDGIDGPTDAAGAMVDSTTLTRAAQLGLGAPESYLAENNSYAFFDALGDTIRTGPTGTNVGDLQILLRGLPPS